MVCLQNEVWCISCCFLNSLGEASTSNLNVSLFPYQAHLVLYEVSQELYLAVRASQLPFTIQCGYFLRIEPMRCLKNSLENVNQLLGDGGVRGVQGSSVTGKVEILQTPPQS